MWFAKAAFPGLRGAGFRARVAYAVFSVLTEIFAVVAAHPTVPSPEDVAP